MILAHHESGHHVCALAILPGYCGHADRMVVAAIGFDLERMLGQPLLPRHKAAIDDLVSEINQFKAA